MDLRDSSLGFYRVWLAATGVRERLFARAWATPAALAASRGLDAAAVARWCRAAEAVGLLERRGERYRLRAEHARRLGDPEDPAYLGAHFAYLAEKSLRFDALPDLLRGKRDARDLSAVYALATSWDHLAFFEMVLPRGPATRALLSRGCDVLDLGAGLGAWTREAKRRFPKARVTMADVEPRRGQLHVNDVPDAAFDLVFLGEVLGAAGDPRVPLATARRALRPGGELHALEGLAPPRGKRPRGWGERLVLAMDFDFGLDGSRFLTVDEARSALATSGFVHRRVRDVGGSLYHLSGRAPKRSNA